MKKPHRKDICKIMRKFLFGILFTSSQQAFAGSYLHCVGEAIDPSIVGFSTQSNIAYVTQSRCDNKKTGEAYLVKMKGVELIGLGAGIEEYHMMCLGRDPTGRYINLKLKAVVLLGVGGGIQLGMGGVSCALFGSEGGIRFAGPLSVSFVKIIEEDIQKKKSFFEF